MKPHKQILFVRFHFDPGLVHLYPYIVVPYPDRFHFLFSNFNSYTGIEVGYLGWFYFDLDIEVSDLKWFHFLFSAFHFDPDIEVGDLAVTMKVIYPVVFGEAQFSFLRVILVWPVVYYPKAILVG